MYHFQSIFIQNFKSIAEEIIDFGVNKTVFVGKNGCGKSNILQAIEKISAFNRATFKKSDFLNIQKPIIIRAKIGEKNNNAPSQYTLHLEARYNPRDGSIAIIIPEVPKCIQKSIESIYIRSDRKIEKNNSNNGFHKLISLILNNKKYFYESGKQAEYRTIKSLGSSHCVGTSRLFISLLQLYLSSIEHTKNNNFNIFIIDQPENFLDPHATKMIDRLLQEIGENTNTQIFYSTHSSELVSNFKKNVYELSDIVFVKKENNISHTHKIQNTYGKYSKIMINLIFKNASIFFSDAIILTEGETERISIPNIYENYNWNQTDMPVEFKDYDLRNFFDLDYHNINLIEVGGKGSLPEWYRFCCEVFGPKRVFAIIDRDKNFEIDRLIISHTINIVHKKQASSVSDFYKYNWIVLDGEFEDSYNIEVIKEFLAATIQQRALKKFGANFDHKKYEENIKKLDIRLQKLSPSNKISKGYEVLFNKYFQHYGKPTIAFHLSTWLSKNSGYKTELIHILQDIIIQIHTKNKTLK